MYGTILAKMWRIYHIFNNPTPNKMVSLDKASHMHACVCNHIGTEKSIVIRVLMCVRTCSQSLVIK